MAFSVATPGSVGGASTGGVRVLMGPELEEIQTDSLGFLALAGARKLRLLPSPWPDDALPPPTSSLLSVASGKGLIAAAGVDTLVVASTESIRAAFKAESSEGNIVPYQPQLSIPMPGRLSHVAFSADESYLVIAAEQSGGLAVFSVDSLMQGASNPAFEISTNGIPLRVLSPNPAPQSAELFAVVTSSGDLLMANLKTRQFLPAQNGQILKQQVSCVSWSTRGKQLVAGLADGTTVQMTPDGQLKAQIPKPPEMTDNEMVSALSWLENNLFLIVHTPTTFDVDGIPPSTFHLVTRRPPSTYGFQRIPDPCFPSGLNRSPPGHFITRLKDFEPGLRDALIVSSTGSTDVGLLTRSKTSLTEDMPAEKTIDVFTCTVIADDARRAQLSMTEDMTDTSTIGLALDLSSKEKVPDPLVGVDMDNSPTPLPAIMLLNNEGLLAAWWFVYLDSILQGTSYPGLVVNGGNQTQPAMAAAPSAQPSSTTFGSPVATRSGTAFGTPQTSATPQTTTPAGPVTTGGAAFGSTSNLGVKASPWGPPSNIATAQGMGSTWAKPSFGTPTPVGPPTATPTFGQASMPGARQPVWGTPATGGAQGGTSPTPGAFGAGQTTTPASGGFGAYANQGGFGALATNASKGPSAFATPGPSAPPTMSSFGGAPIATGVSQGGLSGLTPGGFKLTSTFEPDGTAKHDLPASEMKGTGFASMGLGSSLPEVPPAREAEMKDDGMSQGGEPKDTPRMDTTPISKPSPAPVYSSTPGVGGTFATQSQAGTTPASVEQSKPATLPFEGFPKMVQPTQTALSETPSKGPPTEEGRQRGERQDPGEHKVFSEPPLPPDPTSIASFAVGDSSSSSDKTVAEEAPLPPDFAPKQKTPSHTDVEELALPSVGSEDEADWEGSGEDVGQDISPPSGGLDKSGKLTPQSSFGESAERSREGLGGPFTTITHPGKAPASRPLFGEISTHSVPFMPPPPSRVQQSPRSPSPVRPPQPSTLSRPDNFRSVSMPMQPATASGVNPQQMVTSRGVLAPPLVPQAQPTTQEVIAEESNEREETMEMQQQESVEDTKNKVPEFLFHRDYAGRVTNKGIGGQIERLYSDISSMIDTIGTNASALKAFVEEQTPHDEEHTRNREDLNNEEGWCLVEAGQLGELAEEIEEEFETGRIKDIPAKLEAFQGLRDDLVKLRSRYKALKQTFDARSDPNLVAAIRGAPLNSEQSVQQHDIRQQVFQVQKLLSQAEEDVTLLKAKLASRGGKNGATAQAAPTVEAVVRTIMKLTSMVERKSGDVDVLERHMRQLRILDNGGDDADGITDALDESMRSLRLQSPSSGAGDPRTPNSHRSGNPYGRFYTPDSATSNRSMRGGLAAAGSHSAYGSPLTQSMQSNGSRNGTPRRGQSASTTTLTAEQIRHMQEREMRKRHVGKKLGEVLNKIGPRVRRVED
ncbi:MAG: hypothetical protein M1823_000370 [Watsoniomyces obsoletus]|nr:MAG: hypothetical protein M1823_000370 [Watsoniomyces obsoletus]